MPVCFLPSDIYFTVLYYSGRKQTYFTFGGIVCQQFGEKQYCSVYCVDCGQILCILSMSVEYVEPPL